MGMRYVTRLFRPTKEIDIDEAVVRAASSMGIAAKPTTAESSEPTLLISRNDVVVAADMEHQDGDLYFFEALAMELGGPWIEARIQEGSHWDYSLRYGSLHLDNFSTLPEYWDDDPLLILAAKGRPELLAEAWQIPIEAINKYLVHWGMEENEENETYDTKLTGKAYADDKAEYGDYEQMFDFLKKLEFPRAPHKIFEIHIPKRNFSPKRHFKTDLTSD